MTLQNFCQRGGLVLLALGAAGYAGLATLRPAPALLPDLAPPLALAVPRAEAVAAPASPVITIAAVAPVAAPPPVVAQAVVPPPLVQAVLVTRCPIATGAPAPPRPFRHVWEPRSHRSSRGNILHAGVRGWSDRRVD